MTQTAKKQDVEPIGQTTPEPAVNIIQVIERAALNPNVDIDKMERLLQMQKDIMRDQAKMAYTQALSEMQPNLPIIQERGSIDIGRGKPQRYALWEDINEAIKPHLAEHGFALSFRTGKDGEQIIVTGVLSHRDGHSEETTMHLPADISGSKNAVQAIGSSTSYGKRYTAQALLNLTSHGEDDDGKEGGTNHITDEQVDELIALADEVGADKAKLCEFFEISALANIPVGMFEKVKETIELKRGR